MNWLLAILAALCLGLNVYNTIASDQLRSLRAEVQQRQAYLSQGLRMRQVNNQLINALANVAASQDDEAIRQMLASEGVTFSVNEGSAPVEAVDEDDAVGVEIEAEPDDE